jgi:hypothetical protein
MDDLFTALLLSVSLLSSGLIILGIGYTLLKQVKLRVGVSEILIWGAMIGWCGFCIRIIKLYTQ